MSTESRVEMRGITKKFGGVHALQDVTFRVKPGEIHALVGENGAGKSTLMKILSGAYKKDFGAIYLDGKEVDIRSPHDGRELGIGIIYQEFALAPDLTVAENIFLSHLKGNKFGLFNKHLLMEKAQNLLDSIGFKLNPKRMVRDLSVAYQQIVEIAKALSSEVNVLILDEPTAVLAPEETKKLFEVLRNLAQSGVSIIYISHRLEEVFEIADIITVLKDGSVVDTITPTDATIETVVNLMIGRTLDAFFPKRNAKIGDVIFSVEGLNREPVVHDVSFSVRAGEVFGLAGLVGSGRTETVRAIYGADKRDSGILTLSGKRIRISTPRLSIREQIAFIPEDRKNQGVILPMSIRANSLMANNQFSHFGILNKRKEKERVQELVQQLAIKTQSAEDPVNSLSGGNQQKVVLAKWFNTDSKVVILDEPTRGVDVGAKVEIYRLINNLAEKGLAIIMISSEMMELIGMCDRVAVMRQGSLNGIVEKSDLSEKNIMVLAI